MHVNKLPACIIIVHRC